MTGVSIRYLSKIIIQNFSGIKSLALTFYKTHDNFSANVIEFLANLISNFSDLKSLQIRFVGLREVSDPSMKLLVKRIHASHRHLKNLHIDVSGRLDSLDSGEEPPIPDLFERIAQSGHHQSYSSGWNQLSEKGILQANYLITKYFNTLQELNLNFCHSAAGKITDQVCQELGRGILERMRNLKRLTLNLCGCEGLTNEAMRLFSGETRKKRRMGLEHLTLELADVEIDDIGLLMLGEGICTHFKDLKGLVINLMSNEHITDEGLVEFNRNIVKNIQGLQVWTLAGYWADKIRSEGVKSISKDICQNLKNLRELVLMFSKIDASVLPAISEDIEANFVNLEKLSLSLRVNSSYSAPFSLGKLSHALGNTLKDLKELNLDFNEDGSRIGNDMIMELGKSLQVLVKLKRLALIFDGCSIGQHRKSTKQSSMVGDYKKGKKEASAFRLGVLVPKAAVLERFEANFRWCHGIKDEHVDEFGESLCEFQKELRVMNVSFSNCELLTDASYKKFCRGIKHDMKKLEDLELNFCDCEQISEGLKLEMKVLFKEVPLAKVY